ncbi:hypothetical protein RAB80_014501 [Fusarium oxysporum f. sp. vasinfectum]|nr:hypothetical protein RAB80_017766 [Fusarium oxysporum f. sp. vasinfectum]KAK2670364.1 hypothetical protein RAB80_014501 [Fusarium oxysporum f. sp. vasinfectum]KAK2926667.1 hypothetical protein FoTM2_013536 [Fusarium oxysporum f. sp. vasinfectum]
MNSLIWLWLYPLVSAACDANYALWSPHFGMTVINDLIPALPQVSVEEFETINEGIDADKIGTGGTYTVPYSSEMTINKPAIWSGNCPKTLLLLGEETTQNTPMPSQQSTLSTSTKENTNTPVPASETTLDHTTTSTAGTHKTADQTNIKPTGQATDTTRNKTPTPGKTGSKKATGSAGSEPTGQATDTTRNNTPTLVKTGSKKATGSAGSEPTGQATDTTRNKTPTPGKTGSKKATGSAGSEPTGQATDTTRNNTPTLVKTGSKKATGSAGSEPTGQATDTTRNNTPTLVKTGSKKATGSAGSKPTGAATDFTSQSADPTTPTSAETHSPTAKPWTCWASKDRTLLDNTPKKTRMTAVNEFCRKFKEKPLTPKNRSSDVKQKDLALLAYLHLPCHIDKFEVDEIACLKYFEVIEKKCSDRGGSFQDGCALVWIAKPS